jgi:plasmid stabilization system protein ParE
MLAAIDRLEAFPQLGRVVPEYHHEDLRELIERPYRIVYRIRPGAVIVLMIFRASRRVPALPEH